MFQFRNYCPILLGIYPIFFIITENPDETILLKSLIWPIILIFCLVLMSWFLSILIVGKEKEKRLTTTILLVFIFFSYSHFFEIIKFLFELSFGSWKFQIFNISFGPNKILLPAVLAFFLFIILKVRKSKIDNLRSLNKFFTLVSVSVISIAIFQIGIAKINIMNFSKSDNGYLSNGSNLKSQKNYLQKNLPDIYYIIVDSYANDKTLKKLYNNDNKKFINFLKNNGFFVQENAFSNYRTTHISIASSLNMSYVNELNDKIQIENLEKKLSIIRHILQEKMTKNSQVQKFLNKLGYAFVNFNSGHGATASMRGADKQIECGRVNEFHVLFYRSTIFGPYDKHLRKLGISPIANDLRSKILCQFNTLPEIHKQFERPVFILNHILAPHPPFVFGSEGEEISKSALKYDGHEAWKDRAHYLGQLLFVNLKLKTAINKILSESKTPPIIILQGDHGPASLEDINNPTSEALRERMGILNSYYLPNLKIEKPYDNLSPVNTFRFIFNSYFGTNLSLLEDKAYYSDAINEYKFIDVTNIMNKKSLGTD